MFYDFKPFGSFTSPYWERRAHGEFESECPGYCVAQDTFYVGTLKGVGRVYQQTAIDTYSKVAFFREA